MRCSGKGGRSGEIRGDQGRSGEVLRQGREARFHVRWRAASATQTPRPAPCAAPPRAAPRQHRRRAAPLTVSIYRTRNEIGGRFLPSPQHLQRCFHLRRFAEHSVRLHSLNCLMVYVDSGEVLDRCNPWRSGMAESCEYVLFTTLLC